MRRGGPPRKNVNAVTHGLGLLKRARTHLGSRMIDQRTAGAKAMAAWKACHELVALQHHGRHAARAARHDAIRVVENPGVG
jgi:hypothetical protein